MKRVLVLNGDSYVGDHVARQFYASREYEVEITRSAKAREAESARLAAMSSNAAMAATTLSKDLPAQRSHSNIALGPRKGASHNGTAGGAEGGGDSITDMIEAVVPVRVAPPPYLAPHVTSVVPCYMESPLEFCACVLENDIIIAVIDDDAREAECAIKALMNSHYEVEKTFVMVSSALTWGNTLTAERAIERASRRRARDEARKAFWEEMLADAGVEEGDEGGDDDTASVKELRAKMADLDAYARDEELPPELREPVEDVPDEELVPSRTFTEDAYGQRVPHPRYQHWKELEHTVKHANSATLHTYVLFAGLPYGAGEGPLFDAFLQLYLHADGLAVHRRGGGSDGAAQPPSPAAHLSAILVENPCILDHTVPLIHVKDLAAIAYRVGSAYEVHEERYMFAVDRGNLTVRQILYAIHSRLCGQPIDHTGGGSGRGKDRATAEGGDADVDDSFMVNFLDGVLPPRKTLDELRAQYQNAAPSDALFGANDHLRSFLLSNISAEPGAVLERLPETEWAAVEGLAEAIDRVVLEFRTARGLTPRRLLVTGPPLSGAETLAVALASQYGVPLLTVEDVTRAFERHVETLRGQLVGLLRLRIRRRWARVRARLAREARLDAEEARRIKEEERAAAREAGEEEEEEEEEEDDAAAGDGDDEEGDEEDEERADVNSVSALSIVAFPDEPVHTEAELDRLLTERYILGFTEDGDEVPLMDEEEEEDDQLLAQEEDEATQEEEGNEGALRGHARALAAVRAQDLAERIRVRELRLSYRLALKALSMKMVNGVLPRPKKEDDEEDEEEDEEGGASWEADRSHRRGGGDDDDDEEGDEEDEEDGEGDGDDEEDEGDEEEASAGSPVSPANRQGRRGKTGKGDEDAGPQVVEYLDEAKSFFMRWRMRQPDCRNQGYVMCNYPATVRQACLLYFSSAEEGGAGAEDDDAGGARRALPPTSVEEVPAPLDSDYPFASFDGMEEEQLRALEAQIRQGTLRIVDPRDEGVLAPVQEAFFPDNAIILDDSDATLQGLAAVVAGLKQRQDAQRATPPLTALMQVLPQNQQSSVASNATVVKKKKMMASVNDAAGAGSAPPSPVAPAAPVVPPEVVAADRLLLTGDAFNKRLSEYRSNHRPPHSASAPPTESLVTWLQSVLTANVVGAVPEPVMVHAPRKTLTMGDDDDGADGADGEEEEEEGDGNGPSTARSAEVLLLPAPPRDAATLRGELIDVLRAFKATIHIPADGNAAVAAAAEEGEERDSPSASPSPRGITSVGPCRPRPAHAPLTQGGEPYQWLADKLLRSVLPLPVQHIPSAAPHGNGHDGDRSTASIGTAASLHRTATDSHRSLPSTGTGEAGVEDDAAAKDAARLALLQESEEAYRAEMDREEEAVLRLERNALRTTQVKEQCLGAWTAAQLPMETYLGKYVVPLVTPAMQEVVRLRPDDPVTTLADILYNYRSGSGALGGNGGSNQNGGSHDVL